MDAWSPSDPAAPGDTAVDAVMIAPTGEPASGTGPASVSDLEAGDPNLDKVWSATGVGQKSTSVGFRMWVPGGIKTLRCNWFTGESRREIARLLHCNQISRDDLAINGPETLKVLGELARVSGRPEIAHLPIVASGYSHTTSFPNALAHDIPERLIGIFTGGVGGMGPDQPAAKSVPWMHFEGEKDGKRDMGATHLATAIQDRAGGALFAKAIRWEAAHEWGDINNLFFPWAYQIIALRTRSRPVTEAGGWLVDMPGWGSQWPHIAPYAAYSGNRTTAGWVADVFTAHVWRAYTAARSATPIRITSPAPLCSSCAPTIRRSDAPWAVEVKVTRPATQVELWDGDRKLADLTGPPYRAESLMLAPGVHALIAVGTFDGGQRHASKPSALISTKVSPPPSAASQP